nr:unnamed protein product [Naegleria fowleri]
MSSRSVCHSTKSPSSLLQSMFFWSGALLPLPSIALYILTPGGTVKHFNGEVTPTSKFWCSVAASGDAAISALCWHVLLMKNRESEMGEEVKRLVIRVNWIYGLFHFGAFWFWHMKGEKHKNPWFYPLSLAISTAALLAWGL